MSGAVDVRAAREDDLDWIAAANARLCAESEGRELDSVRVRAGVAAVLADLSRGDYRIAEREGRRAGCLLVTSEWSDWRNGWFRWIQSVWVEPGDRRRGVFRALHRSVVDEARARDDVCGVRLYVEDENASAQATYRAVGMTATSYRVFETDFVLESLGRAEGG